MNEALKNIGSIALQIAVLIGFCVLAVFFIKGGVWLAEKLLPILEVVSVFAFLACLFVLVPLAVFHPTRGFAGVGLFIASYIFGALAWMGGLLLTYTLWGFGGVFLGLFLFGVGVVPIGMLAALFEGWSTDAFFLLLMVVATCGSRFMAVYVLRK